MSTTSLPPDVGSLTPLQLIAGAGLLQNTGIQPSQSLSAAISAYNSLPLIAPLLNTISVGGTGNILSANTLSAVETLGSNSCPALSDSVPTAYAGVVAVSSNPPGFTGAISATANKYLGDGDVSKFAQALSAADGYAQQSSTFINSAVNSQNYLGGTFTTMNDLITGGLTEVTDATLAFGNDLANCGNLFSLSNLNNFGSPLALYQQVFTVCNGVPSLLNAMVAVGIDQRIVITLSDPTAKISDTVQRLMYTAMTRITGDQLAEVLQVLDVKTPNIETMADLLNPVKIFPNSYWTIKTPTTTGYANVYLNDSGNSVEVVNSTTAAVNSSLVNLLPPYVRSSTECC